ncbi:protein CYP5080D1 [Aspergillus nidulans FGSC A4]|uniref:Cytochrome P450, putative (Eurofung) n=1 Tax=Emericella nidulans (strain FGSC A4 / ATCC 38163 / CBS 112.46 / NRRL 194 / M139) TaxID=227321 RepID=C8VG57_EMENI|nr:protein CYP5080D1 [Aspergillus nidulans FGSC A4]CBF81681.1 TPA: cytochrome P450, putative (Eurofung) [Aspergillus nidulans FGSC A4]
MLSSLLSLPAILSFFLALCIIQLVRSLAKSPYGSIPGPALARFTNAWYLWQMRRGDFHRTNIKLHQQNGPVVRIAPEYFSISDPSAVKPVYGHGTKFIKSEWYKAWNVTPDPDQTNLFSEQVSQRHAENRRKVASMYSMSSLVAYEPYVDNCIAVFKQRLNEISVQGKTVDMAHWLQCYAFDVIGEITFGSRFGFLDAGNDVGGVMKSIEDGLAASSYLGLYPWIYPFYLRVLGYLRQGLSYMNEFSLLHIQETRAAMKGSHKDLPSYMAVKLVQAQTENPHRISDWDILATVGANVGAGSDTTAISLSSTLYHLYRNPGCLAKLREEIESAGIGTVIPAFKSTQEMLYLQAVLKEALRVHPGTGFPLFRVVPKGGQVLAGQFFPGGVNVGINSWVLHYDTNIYGADASIFRPERWLEADEEQLKTMEQNYMPFGIGSRTCLGKNISLLEMGKLIPVLVRDYDFDIQGEGDLEARNRWFVKPVDFWIKVTKK